MTAPNAAWAAACLCTIALLAGCSASSSPTATAHATGSGRASTPSSQAAGGIRTVLTPLGLNIHGSASKTAAVVGVAAQGTLLTVVDHQPGDGGWYKVQGQTVTGWIVADPTLSAEGQFTPYDSSRGFSSLYPADWTFAEEPTDTLFRPQQGSTASIVVRTAATTPAFGPAPSGYVSTFVDDSAVVCGYTGKLVQYTRSTGAPATGTTAGNGSSATQLQLYAEIRLRFDAAHAMLLAFNYADSKDLAIFENFYNAITFPYPQCQAPVSPAPSPS